MSEKSREPGGEDEVHGLQFKFVLGIQTPATPKRLGPIYSVAQTATKLQPENHAPVAYWPLNSRGPNRTFRLNPHSQPTRPATVVTCYPQFTTRTPARDPHLDLKLSAQMSVSYCATWHTCNECKLVLKCVPRVETLGGPTLWWQVHYPF